MNLMKLMAELEMRKAAAVVIVIHFEASNYIHLWNNLFSIVIAASLAVDRAGLLSLSCGM
jgi:hypothetical protein